MDCRMTCWYAYMVIICLLYGRSGVGICASSSDEHTAVTAQSVVRSRSQGWKEATAKHCLIVD